MRDYSELKRLAIAAQHDNGDYVALNDYGMAVPPAVVLGLIEEYERVCALNHQQFGDAIRSNGERDQLKRENEELRKDGERYRWLLKNASVILDKKTAYQSETGFIKCDTMPGRTEITTALDAAMGKGEQP